MTIQPNTPEERAMLVQLPEGAHVCLTPLRSDAGPAEADAQAHLDAEREAVARAINQEKARG